MKRQLRFKVLGVALALGGAVLAVMSIRSPGARAQDTDRGGEASLIQIGFEIAPVPLNLAGRNRDLVGLGSFIVNAQADCNGCHTAGGPPNFNYAAGGNPYFGQPQKTDPTVYLAGGANFGPVGTPTGPSGYPGPNMIARNLTPDKNGLAEGGHTLAEFRQILRNGTDFDHVHPTCTAAQIAAIEGGATPACIPSSPDNPVRGDILQIMPWPVFSQMTDHQIEAIYEYLSAIPCIDNTFLPGPTGDPNQLRNDCGTAAAQANSTIQKFPRQGDRSPARRNARR